MLLSCAVSLRREGREVHAVGGSRQRVPVELGYGNYFNVCVWGLRANLISLQAISDDLTHGLELQWALLWFFVVRLTC